MNIEAHNIVALGAAVEAADRRGVWKPARVAAPAGGSAEIRIRPFRESDRETIYRLCCQTGFLGGPVDPLFRDHELFAELFTRPYLDYEADWVFIAEAHQQVIGYLLGSVRPRFDLVLLRSGLRTTTKMLLRLAGGRYSDHPRSRRFIYWLLTAGFREQPKHPANAAHLHLQVGRDHRACGVGRRLWKHYEARLQEIGVTKCYGAFYSLANRRPEVAYTRYGFRVFDRRRTTLFEPEIRGPVEVVCACKTL